MKRTTPTRKQPSTPRLRRVKDPTGRVDWLASRLLESYVRSRRNPNLEMAYEELAPTVDLLLARYLGPRNPNIRKIRSYIRKGNEILRRQAELRARRATA
jgi:hypothetical protein